ncbi:hypothetical protein TrLO_g9889 [Triparma laevis f. longispina]|nr:hypothetical protein TrLO_g9889 [Triparma laevis f. longispina]
MSLRKGPTFLTRDITSRYNIQPSELIDNGLLEEINKENQLQAYETILQSPERQKVKKKFNISQETTLTSYASHQTTLVSSSNNNVSFNFPSSLSPILTFLNELVGVPYRLKGVRYLRSVLRYWLIMSSGRWSGGGWMPVLEYNSPCRWHDKERVPFGWDEYAWVENPFSDQPEPFPEKKYFKEWEEVIKLRYQVDLAIERQESRDSGVRSQKLETVIDFNDEEGLKDFVEFFVSVEKVDEVLSNFEKLLEDDVFEDLMKADEEQEPNATTAAAAAGKDVGGYNDNNYNNNNNNNNNNNSYYCYNNDDDVRNASRMNKRIMLQGCLLSYAILDKIKPLLLSQPKTPKFNVVSILVNVIYHGLDVLKCSPSLELKVLIFILDSSTCSESSKKLSRRTLGKTIDRLVIASKKLKKLYSATQIYHKYEPLLPYCHVRTNRQKLSLPFTTTAESRELNIVYENVGGEISGPWKTDYHLRTQLNVDNGRVGGGCVYVDEQGGGFRGVESLAGEIYATEEHGCWKAVHDEGGVTQRFSSIKKKAEKRGCSVEEWVNEFGKNGDKNRYFFGCALINALGDKLQPITHPLSYDRRHYSGGMPDLTLVRAIYSDTKTPVPTQTLNNILTKKFETVRIKPTTPIKPLNPTKSPSRQKASPVKKKQSFLFLGGAPPKRITNGHTSCVIPNKWTYGYSELKFENVLTFGFYEGEDEESEERNRKVAIFDFDDTLISSGRSSRELTILKNVTVKIRRLASTHELYIVSNESLSKFRNADKMKKAVEVKCYKIEKFLEEVGVNVKVILALSKDKCRKGIGKGAYEIIENDMNSNNLTIDKNESFFVGDADGHGSVAADADLRFAKDAGVKFFVAKRFFKDANVGGEGEVGVGVAATLTFTPRNVLETKIDGREIIYEVMYVEVKSLNDRLDQRQEDWLCVINGAGVEGRVCKFLDKKGMEKMEAEKKKKEERKKDGESTSKTPGKAKDTTKLGKKRTSPKNTEDTTLPFKIRRIRVYNESGEEQETTRYFSDGTKAQRCYEDEIKNRKQGEWKDRVEFCMGGDVVMFDE